ncbi:isochorismatase family protein [Oerskovia enterophila]
MTGIPAIQPYRLPRADELPANVAPWAVDPDRAVLLVHDLQRYFLAPLPREVRDVLLTNCHALVTRCRALGMPIAYTAQPGSMTSEERGLLATFWGPGMRRAPEEQEIVEEVAPQPGDWVLTKWRYSAFTRTDLAERLEASGRDQLVICGVYTHVGVLATAVDAFSRDIETVVVGDATADFSDTDHRRALGYASERCAAVLPAHEVVP